MADTVPISNLPQVTTPLDGDLYPVVNSGVTQKILYSTLYTNISSKVVAGKYVPVDTYNASQSYFASLSPNWQSTYTNVQTNSAAWSATQNTIGLTIFREISSTTSPNDSTFALGFSAVNNGTTGAITNADFVAAPTGAGANLAQIPNNTASGGAKRGQYATDFQKSRSQATQVASGNFSTVAGGARNTASGYSSVVVGGSGNTASGNYSFIGGGVNNSDGGLTNTHILGSNLTAALADYTYVNNISAPGVVTSNNAIFANLTGINTRVTNITGTSAAFTSVSSTNLVGGLGSIASGSYSFIGGGESNTASGMNSAVLGGKTNTASGLRSVVLGGIDNDSTGIYSTTLGFRASATNYGEFAQAAGAIVYKGDNKSSTFLLRTLTNSSVLVSGSAVCYLDGTLGGYEITLPNNSTYAFTTTILGLSSQTDSSGIHSRIRGIAKCNASGVVTLYGVSQVGTLYKQPNTASFNAGMSAGGNILRVVVATPVTSNTYWTARVQGEFLQF